MTEGEACGEVNNLDWRKVDRRSKLTIVWRACAKNRIPIQCFARYHFLAFICMLFVCVLNYCQLLLLKKKKVFLLCKCFKFLIFLKTGLNFPKFQIFNVWMRDFCLVILYILVKTYLKFITVMYSTTVCSVILHQDFLLVYKID